MNIYFKQSTMAFELKDDGYVISAIETDRERDREGERERERNSQYQIRYSNPFQSSNK